MSVNKLRNLTFFLRIISLANVYL